MAFTRIDDRPVRVRCQIYEPDHIIVLDSTLLEGIDVKAGLKENGWIIINSDSDAPGLDLPDVYRVARVDANSIAIKYHLGPKSAPIVNTAILGAFSRVTGLVGLESLDAAVRDAVPINPDGNVAATHEAYERVHVEDREGQ
jgi:2-oxoacid:acceptor oxidoreductase gamma subunit (pyruvate/2-ketoisovalerate family)